MAVDLFLIGVDHHAAPIGIRERMAFPVTVVRDLVRDLRAQPGVREAAMLSTCNRTEIYCTGRDPEPVRAWLSGLDAKKNPEEALRYIRSEANERAAFHAFRVASGIDSMVIGEPQITGQFKSAFADARQAGAAGTVLTRLCEQSLAVAKKIRHETALGNASVSMPALAVKIARRIFPDVSRTNALFVGTGEMVEIGMAHFKDAPAQSLSVSNRTASKASRLAGRFGARRVPFEQLLDSLHEFDIVYACTSSAIPVLGKGALERALKRRKRRPMLLIDLAVPRDIEPEVARLDDVFLYTVDDLGAMSARAGKIRSDSLAEANLIAESHSRRFIEWLDSRARVPAVTEIRAASQRIGDSEVERAIALVRKGKDPEDVIRSLGRRITARLSHPPTRMATSARLGKEEAALLGEMYASVARDGDGDT